MGAPKGNKNGQATWLPKLFDEKTIQIGTKIPESYLQEIEKSLQLGETKAEWLRDAIRLKLGL